MDGNVHFTSRQTRSCRLYLYLTLIVAATLAVLYGPGRSRDALDVGKSDAASAVAVNSYAMPVEPLPVAEQRVADPAPAVQDRPSRPAVKVKSRYHGIIQQAGRRHGVEPAMIKAIIMAESSYNPRAISSRGAVGLMQLMPITADSMGVKDRFDPEHNIDGGVRYFKHMLERFDGDTRLALAAYNAGARKVRKYNGIPPFQTTRSYIDKVFQYYRRYKDLERQPSNSV